MVRRRSGRRHSLRLVLDAGDARANGARSAGKRRLRWLAPFSTGVALSLLWATLPLYLAPLSTGLGAQLFPTYAFVIAYFASAAAAMALFAVLPRGRRIVEALLAYSLPHALVGTVGAALLVGVALSGITPHDVIHPSAPAAPACVGALIAGCIGAALVGCASTCAVMNASRTIKRLSPVNATLACSGTFLVLAALTVTAAFASGPVPCALMTAMPVISWALSRLTDARVPHEELAARGDRELMLVPLRQHDAVRYGAITAGMFLLGGFVLGYAGQYDHLPVWLPAWWQALQSALVLAAFAGLALLMHTRRTPIGVDLLCRGCLPAIAVAMVLIFLPESNAGVLDDVAVCLVFLALMLYDVTTWIIDACTSRGSGPDTGRPFATLRAFLNLGAMVSAIASSIPWAPLDKPKVALALALIMLVVTVVCLPRTSVKVLSLAESAPAPTRDLTDAEREAWGDLVMARDLTAREAQTFSLLMANASQARIARELGVSEATAHTHIQHVYAKFGVHSQRELIRCGTSCATGAPGPSSL